MSALKFDFNNLMYDVMGPGRGVTTDNLRDIVPRIEHAHEFLVDIRKPSATAERIDGFMEWLHLPYQSESLLKSIQTEADKMSGQVTAIISLGIGGSYLGNRMLQDAIKGPLYNDLPRAMRQDRPKIYYAGNNVDPATLTYLMTVCHPKHTGLVVISKSGTTTETKAAFEILKEWLRGALGNQYASRIIAVTDERSGELRQWVKDKGTTGKGSQTRERVPSFLVPDGVGGRFSVLSPVGLITAALAGINIRKLLKGAAAMDKWCQKAKLWDNPALTYGALMYLSEVKLRHSIGVLMPFSDNLKTFADWYIQLLAESLGKHGKGRTPIAALGTTDLHSIQQNNIEGMANKTVTLMKVEKLPHDLKIPQTRTSGFLAKQPLSKVMSAACDATSDALTLARRPNCMISIPHIDEFTLGALIFFFELATAYEGRLMKVNAYDQPGVESYKKQMFYLLGKPGAKPLEGDIPSISKYKVEKKIS